MQVEKHVTISNDFHRIITNPFDEISNELMDELIQHKDEINSLLTGYYCQERGTVYHHTVDPSTVEIDKNGHGSFTVNFTIDYSLEGYTDKDKMEIEFQVDLKTGEMIVKGELLPD